jgi:glycosyltransferase involved in cell wall biosynthesis
MSTGSPKTVLHIVDGLGLSGKTRHLVSIVSALDRRRFTPVVCRLGDEPSPFVAALEAARVPLHTIACGDGLRPDVAARLAKLAWSAKAAIVHCYNPRPMLYGGIAARVLGIRATVGFLSAFACQVPDRAYAFLPQPLATASRRNVYRNRIAAASMRTIVAVSRSLGERFCQYNGVPVEKLHAIGYGVDLRAIDRVPPARASELRRALGFADDDLVIGSVGRLVEQKDYPMQLRAFALAAAREPRLRMAIAGDGPLRSRLERLTSELGVADRVRFLGNQDDVPAFLRSVDLFVLASKFEPFGVALLEAKAAGLPIVATAVNEIPDIIADGVSGVLTPAEHTPSLAAAFVALARDRDRRIRLGARARLAAEQQHSLSAVVGAYQALYDACFEQSPATRAVNPVRVGPFTREHIAPCLPSTESPRDRGSDHTSTATSRRCRQRSGLAGRTTTCGGSTPPSA